MLCQKCGKNQANVYYKQNINGKVTEFALCSDCAAEMGGQHKGFMQGGFAPFGFAPFGVNLFESLLDTPVRKPGAVTEKVCPFCGSSFRELAGNGKVGCAKCYETFRDELAGTISNIHGRTRHVGRAPKGQNAEREKTDRLSSLKDELKRAVDAQDYENAAKLRDEIRSLEKEEN